MTSLPRQTQPKGGEVLLDVERCEVYVPWRTYRFTFKGIAAITAFLVALVGFAYLLEGGDPQRYATAAGAILVLTPLSLLLVRTFLTNSRWFQPFALDQDRVVSQGMFGDPHYIAWSDVQTLAVVHSVVGHSYSPIERNLLVYPKKGRRKRMSIPRLSHDEMDILLAILERISSRHGFVLLVDTRDADARRIRKLPWI